MLRDVLGSTQCCSACMVVNFTLSSQVHKHALCSACVWHDCGVSGTHKNKSVEGNRKLK